MPFATRSGLTCYYRLEGGDNLPVLMLAHSLGQDHGMWQPQVADLGSYFRVLRYDVRGHGATTAMPGEYRIDQLAQDALALADILAIDRFAFCGVSLGGMVGQWIGTHAPERVTHLVLANTSPRADGQRMESRRLAVLSGGMASIADAVMGRFFSPAELMKNPPLVATARRTLLATDAGGYAGCCAAIRDMDQTAALSAIKAPTLVINGVQDQSLPWTGHGERLVTGIAGARVVHLDTAHLSNLEAPRSFTAALLEFLLPPVVETADAGREVRRTVLGWNHVDKAEASSDGFTRDFQELLTRYAWGSVWTRPGLDHRTRRLLVLVMAAALGRWEEFRLHVRAGLDGGLEACDIKEALLQTAVYAGVPAANTAFTIAQEESRREKA